MGQMEIPAKLIKMVKTYIHDTKSKVRFGGEISDEFLVTTGVRQDDALSLALFNIALDSVMRIVMIQAKGIEK